MYGEPRAIRIMCTANNNKSMEGKILKKKRYSQRINYVRDLHASAVNVDGTKEKERGLSSLFIFNGAIFNGANDVLTTLGLSAEQPDSRKFQFRDSLVSSGPGPANCTSGPGLPGIFTTSKASSTSMLLAFILFNSLLAYSCHILDILLVGLRLYP